MSGSWTMSARLKVAAGAAAALALAACGSSGGSGAGDADAPTAGQSQSTASVAISDTWVRATDGTEDPTMTAAFGVLTNSSDSERTIVSAVNDVSDRTELHEMAMENGVMVMRPIEGGITIPAKGSTTLEPGGLHVMIMDLDKTIEPGDDIHVTLTLDDGTSLLFHALAKEFAGGNEQYSGDDADGSSMPMPMGSTSSHSH